MKMKNLEFIFNKFLHYMLISSIFLSNIIYSPSVVEARTSVSIPTGVWRDYYTDECHQPIYLSKGDDKKEHFFMDTITFCLASIIGSNTCDYCEETYFDYKCTYMYAKNKIEKMQYITIKNCSKEQLKWVGNELYDQRNILVATLRNSSFERANFTSYSHQNPSEDNKCCSEGQNHDVYNHSDLSLDFTRVAFSFDRLSFNIGFIYEGTYNYLEVSDDYKDCIEYKTINRDDYKVFIQPETLTIQEEDCTVYYGDQMQLTVEMKPENINAGTYINWSSSNDNVASITSTGLVSFLNTGVATIIATTDNEIKDTIKFIVVQPDSGSDATNVEEIQFPQPNYYGQVGSQIQITPTIYPENATNKNLIWSTSNSSVATVNNGVVTCNNIGTTIITATSNNGITASATLVVSDKPQNMTAPNTFNITPSYIEVTSGKPTTFKVTDAFDKNGDVTFNSDYIWKVDDVVQEGTSILKSFHFSDTVKTIHNIEVSNNGISAYATLIVTPNPIEPTGIILSESDFTLTKGDSKQITATIVPANVSDKTIIWTSTNGSVATVVNGLISAVGTGISTIIATTSNGKFASIAVTVKDKPLNTKAPSDFNISPNYLTAVSGQDLNFSITGAIDETGQSTLNTDYIWYIDNIKKGEGTSLNVKAPEVSIQTNYQIKVINGDIIKYANITVNPVSLDVTDISIYPISKDLTIGDTLSLSYTITPVNATDKSVTWSSSNNDVATISSDGILTALAAGTTTIRVTAKNNKYAEAIITVNEKVIPVERLTLNAYNLNLIKNQTYTLSAMKYPENANSGTLITYASSDISIATVNSSTGLITALNTGTAIITATSSSGVVAKCNLTVSSTDIPVTNLILNTSVLTLNKNQMFQLIATLYPVNATNKKINFKSANPLIASVSDSGLITGVSKGTTLIYAISEDGEKSVEVQVTVIEPLTKFEFEKSEYIFNDLNVQQKLNLITEPLISNLERITYSSSNTNVAIIDSNGNLTIIGSGIAIITALTSDGYQATTKIIVDIPVTSINFLDEELVMPLGKNYTVSTLILPDTATNKTVTYSSSNTDIVLIDNKGNLIGINPGNAIITAKTINGLEATLSVNITQDITSVSLSKTDIKINEGSTENLSVYIQPINSTNNEINWSIQNTDIVQIKNISSDKRNLILEGLKAGTTEIYVHAGNYSATSTITVIPSLKEINIVEEEIELDLKDKSSYTLTTLINPKDCFNNTIKYTSSDNDVATISELGVITALKAGIVTITASDTENLINDTCRVIIKQPVTDIGLNATALTLKPGDCYQLESNLNQGALDKVTYTSSNPFIASVDINTGLIKALEDGLAVITAKCGTISASCYVRVYQPVEKINFSFSNNIIKREGNEVWVYEDLNNMPIQMITSIYPSTATNKEITLLQPTLINMDMEDMKNNSSVISIPDTKTSTLQLVTQISPNCKGDASLSIQYDNNKIETVIFHVVRKVEGINLLQDTVTTTNLRFNNFSRDWEQNSIYLDYEFQPERPSNTNLIWTSSDEDIAVVNKTEGLIIPRKAGSTVITVRTEDGNYYDSCLLIVEQPITDLIYSIENIQTNSIPSLKNPLIFFNNENIYTAITGYTFNVNAKCLPDNATHSLINYISSNPEVATINKNGEIETLNEGTTLIEIYTDSNPIYSKNFTLNVVQPVYKVEIINKKNLILKTNETLKLEQKIYPENATNKKVYWSSSNEDVATVNEFGIVTALKAGLTNITAVSDDGQYSDEYKLEVKNRVENINIINKVNELNSGETYKLEVNLYPDNVKDNTLTYNSSNPEIATISDEGLITTLKRGETLISVISNCNLNIEDEFNLTVNQLATTINVEKDLTLIKGEMYKLNPKVLPEDANVKDLIFVSSNPEIAKVSNEGLIEAISKGETTLTVTTKDNLIYEIINIKIIILPENLIIEAPTKIDKTYNKTYKLGLKFEPELCEEDTIKWSSSNNNIATISNDGLLTILNNGLVTITAVSEKYDLYNKATIEIYTSAEGFEIDRPEKMYDDMEYDWTLNLIPKTTSEDTLYILIINNEKYNLNKNTFNIHFDRKEAGIYNFNATLFTQDLAPLETISFEYEILSRKKETNIEISNIKLSEDLISDENVSLIKEGNNITIAIPSDKNFNIDDLEFDIPKGAKKKVIKIDDNNYKIIIISKDNSTEQEILINVAHKKSDDINLISVVIAGISATLFNDNISAILPIDYKLQTSDFEIILSDKKANYLITDDFKYLIVTAESGITKTYNLNLIIPKGDARIKTIQVGDNFAIFNGESYYINSEYTEDIKIITVDPNAKITLTLTTSELNYLIYEFKIESGHEVNTGILKIKLKGDNPNYIPIEDETDNEVTDNKNNEKDIISGSSSSNNNSSNNNSSNKDLIIDNINNINTKESNNLDYILVSKEDKNKLMSTAEDNKDLIVKDDKIVTSKDNKEIITIEDFLTKNIRKNVSDDTLISSSNKYTVKENDDGTLDLILPAEAPSNALSSENIFYDEEVNKYYLYIENLGLIELNPQMVSTMVISAENNIGYLDNKKIYIKDKVEIIDDEYYLPMRQILEYLGAEVDWTQDEFKASFRLDNKLINIYTNNLTSEYKVINERIYTTLDELISSFDLISDTISKDTENKSIEILKDITSTVSNIKLATTMKYTLN